MRKTKSQDKINERCGKLQAYGLEIWHNDSSVNVVVDYEDVTLDFSAYDEDKWLLAAIQQAYRIGKERGAAEIQCKLRNLIGAGE